MFAQRTDTAGTAFVQAVFAGKPEVLTDERGTWISSICRKPVHQPITVTPTGLTGDQVAQPYHGSPEAAVCAHLMDHYRFWNAQGMALQPGGVGENLTLDGVLESDVCAGDVVRIGTAVLQVSGPRTPCANLARFVGRQDWVKQTVLANRTGFYLRVLTPGMLRAGDSWIVEDRPSPGASIVAINHCVYLEFEPETAKRLLVAEGLAEYWKNLLEERLAAKREHWTETMAR